MAQLEPDRIRERIREARKEAGLSQEKLADLLEVHKRTVENYENVRVPWEDLNRIARVLAKPVEWFLWGRDFAEEEERFLERLEGAIGRLEGLAPTDERPARAASRGRRSAGGVSRPA